MLIGTAVCGKPHVRWCERAGEIKPSPLYSIAWYQATAAAALTAANQTITVTKTVSNIGNINLPIVVTFTQTGSNPVMVNDAGHEKVWQGESSLVDLDEDSMRDGVVRWATVTAQVTDFGDGASDQAKAAALDKTYHGSLGTSTARLAIHSNTWDGKEDEEWLDSGWLTSDAVSLTGIEVTYSASAYHITSDVITLRVCVAGFASGNEATQKDYTYSNGLYTNTLTMDGVFTLSSITENP